MLKQVISTVLLLSHATSLPSASYCLTGTAPSSGVGSGTLSSGWQIVAVPDTSVATNLDETLDVKVDLFSKLTLNPVPPVNQLSETINLIFSEAIHPSIRTDIGLI
jgi:hypothetical protein